MLNNMEISIDELSFALLEIIGCVVLKSLKPGLDRQRKWKRIPQDGILGKLDKSMLFS